MKTLYANLDNSLMSKYELIQARNHTQDYDIMAFCEIKPKFGTIPDLPTMAIEGYDLFTSKLAEPNTRGTCIYAKKSLGAQQVFPDAPTEYNDCTWITVKGQSSARALIG